jgi:hypothetical protein
VVAVAVQTLLVRQHHLRQQVAQATHHLSQAHQLLVQVAVLVV